MAVEHGQLRRLAGAVDAFDRQEPAWCGHRTPHSSLLCAARSRRCGRDLVSPHRVAVIRVGCRELVPAVPPRDKVERAVHERCDDRFDRGGAGGGNRSRWQALVQVRVVGGVELQVGLSEITVEFVAEAVDHGRIGLEPHAATQPRDEHTRDSCAFLGCSGLLLHDRREDQRLVRRRQRKTVRPPRPRRIEKGRHRVVRAAQKLNVRGSGGKVIRLGKETSFRMVPAQSPIGSSLRRPGFRPACVPAHRTRRRDAEVPGTSILR